MSEYKDAGGAVSCIAEFLGLVAGSFRKGLEIQIPLVFTSVTTGNCFCFAIQKDL
jgi:hypothetical protein